MKYPDHHIWTYCLNLGEFTDPKGKEWELGVYVHPRQSSRPHTREISFAIVYGPEPHQYISGAVKHPLDRMARSKAGIVCERSTSADAQEETLRRLAEHSKEYKMLIEEWKEEVQYGLTCISCYRVR